MGIRWGRILAGGLLAELGILVGIAPFAFTASADRIFFYLVPPLSLVMTLVFGCWTAKRVESRFVLHGTLVGVFAAVSYLLVAWGQPLPSSYFYAHWLKVVGGALGGLLVSRLKRASSAVVTAAHGSG
jgi:hypothetical protein